MSFRIKCHFLSLCFIDKRCQPRNLIETSYLGECCPVLTGTSTSVPYQVERRLDWKEGCAHMAELTNQALARYDIEGDGDPLDICVLTEKDVTHGDIIVRARPIGGLRLLDHGPEVAKDVILRSMQDYQELISEKQLAKTSKKK